MKLSKTAQGIIAVVLVGWIAALALLIALRPAHAQTNFATAGALEQKVAAAEGEGLNIVGLSPADIYGEEWIAAAVICPFASTEGIERGLDVDASELKLGHEGVPEDSNYLLLRGVHGEAAFDHISRSDIDLCTIPLQGYFDSRVMLPLGKIETDGWQLLG